jgi:hypothetical protein
MGTLGKPVQAERLRFHLHARWCIFIISGACRSRQDAMLGILGLPYLHEAIPHGLQIVHEPRQPGLRAVEESGFPFTI